MNYKEGYLAMFTQITILLEQLQVIESPNEKINVIRHLQDIQAAGENACIGQ